MDIEMAFKARNMSKEELRALLQKIREWELGTPRTELDSFTFTSNPELSKAETMEIFDGISPKFKNVVSIPLPKNPILSLGTRGIVVKGKLIGTCDEFTLSLGESSEEDVQALQTAETISLVRIRKG